MHTKQELAVRDSITKLKKAMEALPNKLTSDDFKTHHHFTTGLYARETTFPQGSVVVGKIHRENHLLILLQGECLVASTEGLQLMKAPHISVAKSGIQRAGFAKTTCVFITVHATEETNLEEIENKLIAPDYNSLEVLQWLG